MSPGFHHGEDMDNQLIPFPDIEVEIKPATLTTSLSLSTFIKPS